MKRLLYALVPDIINPLDGFWGRLRHGRMHRFVWCGATGATVERILRKYGIPCYGREIHPDNERACLVPAAQAEWAEYLLVRAGVPLTCRRINAKHKPGSMPTAWGVGVRRPSLVARIARMLGV